VLVVIDELEVFAEVERSAIVLADEVERGDVTLLQARAAGQLAGWPKGSACP
jgi:hypothetical protein